MLTARGAVKISGNSVSTSISSVTVLARPAALVVEDRARPRRRRSRRDAAARTIGDGLSGGDRERFGSALGMQEGAGREPRLRSVGQDLDADRAVQPVHAANQPDDKPGPRADGVAELRLRPRWAIVHA